MKTKELTFVAIALALCIILEVADKLFLTGIMPQGGAISIASLPILMTAFYLGPKQAITVGILSGLLQGMLGLAYILTPLQYILEYPIALGCIGVAGYFKGYVGCVVGNGLRFMMHVLAGVIFFRSYAGAENVWWYVLSYNLTWFTPTLILSLISISVLKRFKNK